MMLRLTQISTKLLPKDPIWRFMVKHWGLGMVMGAVFAAAILVLDIGHLRTLMAHSDMLVLASIMLFAGFSLTFGAIFCGTAVMSLGDKPASDKPEGGKMIAIPVMAKRRVEQRANFEE